MEKKNSASRSPDNGRVASLTKLLLATVAVALCVWPLYVFLCVLPLYLFFKQPSQPSPPRTPTSQQPHSISPGKTTPKPSAPAENSPLNNTPSSASANGTAKPDAAPSPQPAEPPPAPAPAPATAVRIAASHIIRTSDQDLASEPWKIREERRELSESFLNIGNRIRNGEPAPEELEFPLFDGKSITLTNFEYQPQSLPNEGVFFAKVKGDTSGNHVLFSYVNNSLVGAIHVPSLDLFFDIRNATQDGGLASEIFLAQLNPEKMPTCGTCRPGTHAPPTPAPPSSQQVN